MKAMLGLSLAPRRLPVNREAGERGARRRFSETRGGRGNPVPSVLLYQDCRRGGVAGGYFMYSAGRTALVALKNFSTAASSASEKPASRMPRRSRMVR